MHSTTHNDERTKAHNYNVQRTTHNTADRTQTTNSQYKWPASAKRVVHFQKFKVCLPSPNANGHNAQRTQQRTTQQQPTVNSQQATRTDSGRLGRTFIQALVMGESHCDRRCAAVTTTLEWMEGTNARGHSCCFDV